MTDAMHLAQVNIGRLVAAPGDPAVEPFMAALARVNAIAERSPGFVWRLKGEDDATGATDIRIDETDPRMAINLSVWETVESFEDFVWKTVHRAFYARRTQWFEPLGRPHFAMWWVEPGTRPTVAEAMARLADLEANGPSERAFGWADLPSARLWREARCA